MWGSVLVLLGALVLLVLSEEYVLQYTSENFKDNIQDHGNFIMFYAPWCSHCVNFHPIWNELAEMVNSPDSNFAIAQIDCTIESKLCQENEITGYPTLLYFKQNSFQSSEYRGTRDLPSLALFLNEMMAETNKEATDEDTLDKVKIYKGLAYLTDQNLDKFVSKGQHFIMFYAPWCAVSQTLAPTWSYLAEQYAQNDSIHISKIDCMDSRITCLNFDIKDYPHLVWMVNGKVMDAITGLHSLQSLLDFVERMAIPENHNPERFMRKKRSQPIAKISEETFDLYMREDLVFVNYFATWCAHCKLMVPTWLELARRYLADESIIIADVDCGQSPALCAQEDVDHFPTLVLYKKGAVTYTHRGSTTIGELLEEIEKHLDEPKQEDVVKETKDEL